jgi:hypothetical protein
MESPRSSLFSTLIMTLPLVVVPAIALLRPPAPGSGTSANALGAAEDDDFFSQLDDFDTAYAGRTEQSAPSDPESSTRDEFEEWFPEDHETGHEHDHSPEHAHSPGDPFLSSSRDAASSAGNRNPADVAGGFVSSPGPSSSTPESVDDDEVMLLRQMHSAGVSRTMWFAPGTSGSVGFAAFVPGDDPAVVYRFEAVAASRRAVLLDVVRQLSRWRSSQNPTVVAPL